jgi:hypothetical protein
MADEKQSASSVAKPDLQLPAGLTPDLVMKLLGAITDPSFREAFIGNPKAAYQARFGQELLPGEPVEIKKLKNGGHAVYLPTQKVGWPIPTHDELEDELLQLAAGGKGGSSSNGKQQDSNAKAMSGSLQVLGAMGGEEE